MDGVKNGVYIYRGVVSFLNLGTHAGKAQYAHAIHYEKFTIVGDIDYSQSVFLRKVQ